MKSAFVRKRYRIPRFSGGVYGGVAVAVVLCASLALYGLPASACAEASAVIGSAAQAVVSSTGAASGSSAAGASTESGQTAAATDQHAAASTATTATDSTAAAGTTVSDQAAKTAAAAQGASAATDSASTATGASAGTSSASGSEGGSAQASSTPQSDSGALLPAANILGQGTFASNPGATWTLTDDGVLLITGSGVIDESYSQTGNLPPWYSLRQSIKNVTITGTVTTINLSNWFFNCGNLVSIVFPADFGDNCMFADSMCEGCSSLQSLSLPANFSEYSSISANRMCFNCTALASISLPSTFGAVGFLDAADMFAGCSSLASMDLPFNFGSKGRDISGMFRDCSACQSIPLNDYFGQNATNLANLFNGCSSLQRFSSSTGFGQNAQDMSNLFSGCSSLQFADLSGMDTRAAQNMSGMFDGCTSLQLVGLGANFTFKGSGDTVQCTLPAPTAPYRSWRAIGTGDPSSPAGDSWSSADLASCYSSAMVDGYVPSTNAPETPLTGSVAMWGDSYTGGTMMASFTGVPADADLVIEWYSSGSKVAEGSSYTLQSSDLGHYISAAIRDTSGLYSGKISSSSSLVQQGYSGKANMPDRVLVGQSALPYMLDTPPDSSASYTWYIASDDTSPGTQIATGESYTPQLSDFGKYIYVVAVDSTGKYPGSITSSRMQVLISGKFGSTQNGRWTITPDGVLTFSGDKYDHVRETYSVDTPPPWCAYSDLIKSASFTGAASYASFDAWFLNCTNLESVKFPSAKEANIPLTSDAADSDHMFAGCTALDSVSLYDGFGSKSSTVASMFESCASLEELDLPEDFGAKATDFSNMLKGCSSLTMLDLMDVNSLNAESMSGLFDGCTSLRYVALGANWSFKGAGSTVLCSLADPTGAFDSWQAMGQGTIDSPSGDMWHASYLASQYRASMADVYEWSKFTEPVQPDEPSAPVVPESTPAAASPAPAAQPAPANFLAATGDVLYNSLPFVALYLLLAGAALGGFLFMRQRAYARKGAVKVRSSFHSKR